MSKPYKLLLWYCITVLTQNDVFSTDNAKEILIYSAKQRYQCYKRTNNCVVAKQVGKTKTSIIQ